MSSRSILSFGVSRARSLRSGSALSALLVLSCVALLGGLFGSPGGAPGALFAGGGNPLDLPSGGRGISDDEDQLETIAFYGGEYEGDGFFWCLDRSGSMEIDDRLGALKVEVTAALSSLSKSSQIGLVSFATGTSVWQNLPRSASVGSVASAKSWVNALTSGGVTCLGPAGVKTIEISNLCDREKKQIFVVSDGAPSCFSSDSSAQALISFASANWQRTPVNTIFIGDDSSGIAFMQALAANGGTYRQVGQ